MVGVAEAAAPADAVGGIWANVHAVAKATEFVTDFNLLAIRRARDECCAIPDEVGLLESVERDDYRGRSAYAFGRQCQWIFRVYDVLVQRWGSVLNVDASNHFSYALTSCGFPWM